MTLPADRGWPDMDGVTHGFAQVGPARLHYAEAGQGEPVVLLHGWPQHWYAWRHVILPLAASYRVICPDIRGLGWSEGPGGGYRLSRLAADLVGLMDTLGIGRARLVGHDWGGAVGYIACIDHPERFERFAALATFHPWVSEGSPPVLFARPWHFYLLALPPGRLALRSFGLAENRLRAWRREGEFTPEEIDLYAAKIRTSTGTDATLRFYRALVWRELPWLIRHGKDIWLTVPTLHLNGELDKLTHGMPGSFRRHAADMTMETVPRSGHFIAEEQPKWLLERLLPFLARPGNGECSRQVPQGLAP